MFEQRKNRNSRKSGRTRSAAKKEKVRQFKVKLFGNTFILKQPSAKRLFPVLLASVPAILGLVLAVGSVGGMVNISRDKTMDGYRERILAATESDPLPPFVYKRAIGHFAGDHDIWAGYLASLDRIGQSSKSINYLLELAPENGSGDPRFHLALAERLLALPNATLKARTLAEKHLRMAIETATGSLGVGARRQLALLQLVRGERENAFNTLLPVMTEDPVAGSEALWVAWSSGLNYDINAPARVLARLERDLRGQVTPDVVKAISKIRLMIVMNQESNVREWLSLQKTIKPEDRSQIDKELAEMSMIASIVRGDANDKMPEWSKLQPLLEKEPDHPLWTRLAIFIWANSDKPAAKPVRDWVQKHLDGESTGPNLLKQAIAVTSSKYQASGKSAADSEQLRKLYRKLLKTSPDDVLSLNNLSMLIYKYEPDHLEEGLAYARHAEKLAPNIPAVRDTVGEILARMGKWDEALPILESCVTGLPEEWNLHNTLAQIYDQKGMKDRSEAHRAALARIKRPLDADNYERLPGQRVANDANTNSAQGK